MVNVLVHCPVTHGGIRKIIHLFATASLLAALILGCLPPHRVSAGVTITIRYVKLNGKTSGTCNSWANACTLRSALNLSGSGDEIWVAADVYKPTAGSDRSATWQLKNGVALYGGFTSSEITRDQRDPLAQVTTLSGEIGAADNTSDNSYHVVTGSGAGASAVLDGFTISGGNADGSPPNNTGGGIYINSGSPTLTDLIINRNNANFGGGIHAGSASSPSLGNITFSENTAHNRGGGMYNSNGSNPSLEGVTFNHNHADIGGGMHNDNSSPQMTGITFSANTAGVGGGMANLTNSAPTLNNAIFIGNSSAGGYGGGMYNYWGSSPQLTNVTFTGNTAYSGGGMCNYYDSSPALNNVTLSGNSASWGGGGMYNHLGSNVTIKNSILWGNTAANNPQIYNQTSNPLITDSVIQGGCPALSFCGSIITADPRLGSLGAYGGTSPVLPLLPGSSAINAGNASTCAATDQRGFARLQGMLCDMGAFESQGFTLSITSGGSQHTPLNTAFVQPLALSISSTYDEPVDGGAVLFTPPASGASAVLTGSPATITGGTASVTAAANSIPGAFTVTAGATGTEAVAFYLCNQVCTYTFLPVIQR